MKKQLHPNLFEFDESRTAEGFLFATHNDRARYLGQWSWDKPDWLKQNEGRYRRIEDVLRDGAPGMPGIEAEINPDTGPTEPADSSSSPEVRNNGDDKGDVASAYPRLGDRSRPREPTSLPIPVKENAKKQKSSAGIAKSARKRSPELMRIVLDILREYPVLSCAAWKAGIHRKTIKYWIKCSKAGHEGYDVEWQGVTERFHEHCESAIEEAHERLFGMELERAMFGYDKVLTWRGRVSYKIDQELVGLGFEGPDAYLRDENGNLVPETIRKYDPKSMQWVLKYLRPEVYGNNPKIDTPHEGGVLVIGETKKPEYDTAASVRARQWKAEWRRIDEEKD
jgi:hypothetical protein